MLINLIRLKEKYFKDFLVKIALDIGSRDGESSIALKNEFPHSKIYAFECNPDCIAQWKKVAKNKDITLIEKAISDKDGTIQFYSIDPEKTLTSQSKEKVVGASSLFKANPKYPYEKYNQIPIDVQSIRLDTWCSKNNIKQVDLMWIDAQGAELLILKGMRHLLNSVKLIHVEVSFRPLYLQQPLFRQVNHFLQKNHFVFAGFENISGWFGDANYINGLCLPWPNYLFYKFKGLYGRAYSVVRAFHK